MIYAFTDSEMMAFSLLSGLQLSTLSPLYDLCADVDELNDLDEKVSGLIKMNLVRREADRYVLTAQGTLMSEALFTPDYRCEMARKNSVDASYNVLRCGQLWHVHSAFADKKLHLIWTPFSKELVIKWLQNTLLSDYHPDTSKRTEQTDCVLTYDEWIVFLVSQFIFMKRGFLRKRPIDPTFTANDLYACEAVDYYVNMLTALDAKKFVGPLRYLFQPENADTLQKALDGLCEKGIFGEGDGHYVYTDMTVHNVDNDMLFDTLKNNVFGNSKNITSKMAVLCKNGLLLMHDDGESVHLTSADELPFTLYLE